MKDVKEMTDSELAELIEQADIMAAARKEQERRRMESDKSRSVASIGRIRSTITTHACCPSCGKRDAVLNTRPMYATDMLGRDGKPPIGTLAYCKCGARYDAGTGEFVGKAFTY